MIFQGGGSGPQAHPSSGPAHDSIFYKIKKRFNELYTFTFIDQLQCTCKTKGEEPGTHCLRSEHITTKVNFRVSQTEFKRWTIGHTLKVLSAYFYVAFSRDYQNGPCTQSMQNDTGTPGPRLVSRPPLLYM